MGIVDGVKTWLFTVALKKALQNGIKVGLSWIASVGIVSVLPKYGVNVDINPTVLEGSLTALLTGCLEIARNWLKVKFPKLSFL